MSKTAISDVKRPRLQFRHLAVLAAVGLQVCGLLSSASAEQLQAQPPRACEAVGSWLDPATGKTIAAERLLRALTERDIILLGESHDNAEHHLWQLHTLAGLHAHRSRLVVGFEMFPTDVQPALDAWSAGRYAATAFLKASRWREVWGYDPALYLPLFHFVRQNRLPMIALNVDRRLIARVGRQGWSAVPAAAREGVSDPAPASDAYRRALAKVYAAKQEQGLADPLPQGGREPPQAARPGKAPDLGLILGSDAFARFVEAQVTWDRAMAQALFQARREDPEALVVGVLGRGHAEHGYGVPHQLADLGEDNVAVLLPVEAGRACATLDPDVADAVFVLAPSEGTQTEPDKPRLGVVIEQASEGVKVLQVIEGSVAQEAGIAAGDDIVSAASSPIRRVADLIEIVQRQAPGTWLPIVLKRGDEKRQLVAKFPARPE